MFFAGYFRVKEKRVPPAHQTPKANACKRVWGVARAAAPPRGRTRVLSGRGRGALTLNWKLDRIRERRGPRGRRVSLGPKLVG